MSDIKPILLKALNDSPDLKISKDTIKIKSRDSFTALDFKTERLLDTLSRDSTFNKVDLNGDEFLSYEEIVKLGRIAGDKEQITSEDLALLRYTRKHMEFVFDNPNHNRVARFFEDPEFRESIDHDYLHNALVPQVVANRNSLLAEYVMSLERLVPNKVELEIVKQSPDSFFAIGVAKNPNRTLFILHGKQLKEIAWKNPNSKFAEELPHNKNYFVSESDQLMAREVPDCKFTTSLLTSNNYMVTEKDHWVAQGHPNSSFAQRIVSQPSFEVTKEDKEFIRKNPDCWYAIIVGHRTYELEREDFVVANANRTSKFSGNMGQHPGYQKACEKILGFYPREYPPNVK